MLKNSRVKAAHTTQKPYNITHYMQPMSNQKFEYSGDVFANRDLIVTKNYE